MNDIGGDVPWPMRVACLSCGEERQIWPSFLVGGARHVGLSG